MDTQQATPTRPRPRGRPGLTPEVREQALLTAGELLAEQGLKGMQARTIAARAGLSVGSIYKLFGDIDDLIRELNLRTYRDIEIHHSSALEASGLPPEAVFEDDVTHGREASLSPNGRLPVVGMQVGSPPAGVAYEVAGGVAYHSHDIAADPGRKHILARCVEGVEHHGTGGENVLVLSGAQASRLVTHQDAGPLDPRYAGLGSPNAPKTRVRVMANIRHFECI